MTKAPVEEESKPWPLYLAAAISAFVFGALIIVGLVGQQSYNQAAENRTAQYAEYARHQITETCSRSHKPELAPCRQQARAKAQIEYHDAKRNEYDLAAQRTTALWTLLMGLAAIFGVGLSAVGVYLVYKTFQQSLAQAADTAKAIGEATRSADAMEGVRDSMAINAAKIVESVSHQETFGMMQMRAYVSVVIGLARYQDEVFLFEARPKIINSGHTPAKNVRWRIAAQCHTVPLPSGFRFPLPKQVCGGSDLPPHQDAFMGARVDTRFQDQAEADTYKWGFAGSLYVWGVLWYDDVFGQQHHTSFAQRLWFEPTTGEGGQTIWNCQGEYLPRHNRST